MKKVTLRELHAKTGDWVRAASIHGDILVTDNGRAIARITPGFAPSEVPFFARRKPSKAFARLDASGKTGDGGNSTQFLSEDQV